MKEVAIKDICKKDSSALKQKELLPEGKYPVFGASGIAGYLDRYHQKKEYIGIVKDGSGIGRVAFYPAESSLIGTMQYVLPKENYDIRYIGYCLQSLDLSKYKQGAAIPHIYFRDYGEQLVKVTDNWEEQHSIVSRLDSAFSHIDALKANAEKQLNEARKLFQAELTECMKPKEGWEEKTLKEVSEIAGEYGLNASSKPFDGVRYLRITDITDFGYLNDDKVSANVEDGKKQDELVEGDILFARTGATVGKTLVYRKDFGDCLFAGYLIRYRLKKDCILPRFIHYITHSKEYYKWVETNQEAAAQPNISAKKYNMLFIRYPNIDVQHRIVSHLDSLSSTIRKLEELQQKTFAECDALKQAMLREVFE